MGEVVRVVLEKLTRARVLFNGKGSDTLFKQDSFPTKYISEILRHGLVIIQLFCKINIESFSDESGSYVHMRDILDELGIDHYSFSDMLLLREVCIVVSRRSANLGAAAIACVLNRVRKPNMVVGIDGSTYKYHPFFDFWVHDKLKELVDPGLNFKLLQTADGSGKGAALITAIISRLKKREQQPQQQPQRQPQPQQPRQHMADGHVKVAMGENVEMKGSRKQPSSMNESQKVDLMINDMPTYDSFNGEVENAMIHLSNP
ncbi:unnamed protein product [Acanthocheilonema viteae]|uniref:Phosphotransferase n=1 Tax=Acanthocheilonema viteae TaxID=6277 RepID=A0A498SFY6_ACAVI|nr:unnamed protein product [Acanthocheilonema viteae]